MDFAVYRKLARQFVLTRSEEDYHALSEFLDAEFGMLPKPKWNYDKANKRTWKYLNYDVAKCMKTNSLYIKLWHMNPNFKEEPLDKIRDNKDYRA